jgi:metal-responsive CopG/Arc/MetJ family transcriptional regulator
MNSSGKDRPRRLGRPPKWGKRRQLNIWLPVELADKMDAFRHKDGASQAEFITRAVVEILEREER